MNKINLTDYYKNDHSFEFFTNSRNLIYKSEIKEFIEQFSQLATRKFTEENNFPDVTMKFRNKIIQEVDEFNFFLIRLSIGLEMALKGLFLYNHYNIFMINNDNLMKINELNYNITSSRTQEFNFFIQNIKSISESLLKYQKMITFFQKVRNDYIHFAKDLYNYNNKEVIINIMSLDDFMKNEIIPLIESVEQR